MFSNNETAPAKPRIILLIPAYNEEKCIVSTVENLRKNYPQYDFIIINDGSTDTTEEIIREHCYPYLSLCTNLGIGGAMQTGYKYAAEHFYDIAIQFDGDGQHDPAYIEKLIEPIINGKADFSIGSRFIEKLGFQTTVMRRFGNRFIAAIIRLCCGVSVTDSTSGFRAANFKAIKLFAYDYAHDYPEPEAIVTASLNGLKVCDCAVQMNERSSGVSSINFTRSIYYMIKVSIALVLCRIRNRRQK